MTEALVIAAIVILNLACLVTLIPSMLKGFRNDY